MEKKAVFKDLGATCVNKLFTHAYCEESMVAKIMLAIVFTCGIAFQKLVALDILESLLE
jgi:hypothetical protein